MNFTCRKLKCKHNNNCVCNLDKIAISKEKECEMLVQNKEYVEDKTKTMFDKVPTFNTVKHHKEVDITCKADCIFNSGGECMSNGIVVTPCPSYEAGCLTYLKK